MKSQCFEYLPHTSQVRSLDAGSRRPSQPAGSRHGVPPVEAWSSSTAAPVGRPHTAFETHPLTRPRSGSLQAPVVESSTNQRATLNALPGESAEVVWEEPAFAPAPEKPAKVCSLKAKADDKAAFLGCEASGRWPTPCGTLPATFGSCASFGSKPSSRACEV